MRLVKRLLPFFALLTVTVVMYSCSEGLTGSDEDENKPQPFNSLATPGDSAKSFLEGDQYSTLNLEIDYMEGYKPTQAALDSLEIFLNRHLNKASINVGIPNSIEPGGQNAYSVEDVVNLEEQHRNRYTAAGSDTLWAYFLVLDGEFSQQNVLGIAYFNTSMAFFGQTIQDYSGDPTQPSTEKMEATVFRHEIGHNIGLVNNGTPMVPGQEHQDSANGHHCTEEECLMYYAVETTDYFDNLFDGNIPDLLQYCNADLEANGGK